MSLSITLTFRWAMGHRILGLVGPGSKCANVHGHNWEAEVTLANDDGALEFGAVKANVQEFIDHYWDHGFIAHNQDEFVDTLEKMGSKVYLLGGPPTTEAIAADLAEQVRLRIGVDPLSVHVREGYRNAATWTP